MMNFFVRVSCAAVAAMAAGLIFAGCAFTKNTAGNGASYGEKNFVTISNFDFKGQPVELHFSQIPRRVIVTQPEIADLLIRIGAGDSIRMLSLSSIQNRKDKEQYQKALPHAEIVTNEIDRETALMEEPDCILGWRRSFRRGALGDTSFWKEKEIPVYIEENSGPIPAVKPFPPCTVESEMQFIRNMGIIFQKEKAAGEIIGDIENTMEEARQRAASKTPRKALILEFMGNEIELFGPMILTGDIIQKMGSTVLTYETPFISREQLASLDPDVIFLIYHGGEEERTQALAEMKKIPLSHLSAVREGHIYPLPYRYVAASNIYTADSIRAVYEGLYEDGKNASL